MNFERLEAIDAHLQEGGKIGEPVAQELFIHCLRLRSLVIAMLENDPSELAADGGITVLDVWRKDARALLRSEAI